MYSIKWSFLGSEKDYEVCSADSLSLWLYQKSHFNFDACISSSPVVKLQVWFADGILIIFMICFQS